ncbi:rod shape-determining protein RodA [Candidatus Clostridium radicumherbarum]|uniref:Rod shape-determining protein RodA n=1 Tax=Candidatus Clostridium radicumherbarum TaxID=3381662 RepID=A0ABW8TRY6_9CLOT
MIDFRGYKKKLKNLDYILIIDVVIILIFGLLNIYSTMHLSSGSNYVKLQFLWIIIGFAIIIFISSKDFIFIKNYTEIIYWASIALLVFNDISSRAVKGAASWIRIGSIAIEPGEFVKIGLILILSKKIEDFEGNINNAKNLLILIGYSLIPIVLILIQPNVGMALICFFITLGILFIAGLDLKIIYTGFISVIPISLIIWFSGILKIYQKNRIISFINPGAYESDIAYQLTQSLIGIGSGGLLGKGFLNGTQIAGGFIPEVHTDFIFSCVGEEWGLIGGIFLILLYFVLLMRIMKISNESHNIMSKLVCVGVISSLLFSIFQNIGMTIGIMPIAGITLPLMSYGGSSILANLVAIGIVLCIGTKKGKLNL